MNVVQVVKAKPFAVLPGSGMSIQVTLKNGRKVGVVRGVAGRCWVGVVCMECACGVHCSDSMC